MGLDIVSYLALDVETPNARSDALCSIGVVYKEYGQTVFEREYLVNPETYFDPFNIDIHGITPSMIYDAPTFPEVWEQIAPYALRMPVLAHSATFDLSVISRTLQRYELPAPVFSYICTCRLARRHIEKERFGNHRLNTLCEGLMLPLVRHHNALYDAQACAALFDLLLDKYGVDERDVLQYPPVKHAGKRSRSETTVAPRKKKGDAPLDF